MTNFLISFLLRFSRSNFTIVTTGMVIISFVMLCNVNVLMSESEGQVMCKCGRNPKQFITPCEDNCALKPTCSKFKSCASCKDGYKICASCPHGLSGPNCQFKKRKKRALFDMENFSLGDFNNELRVKRATCPSLRPPKAGQITCWSNHLGRECTGTCIPGYTFQNRRQTSIVLKCSESSGVWEPERNFPQCISTGECDLEMAGAGKYNCTSTTIGTHCDVRCGRDSSYTRYFCYPGRRWEPSLPNCVRRKAGVIQPQPQPPPPYDCKCQNGGICVTEARICRCPQGTHGLFCEEHVYPTKTKCPDPGYITYGDRINSGPYASRGDGIYEEGESVVYSCRRGFALIGQSLLTCQSTGSWSFSKPTCQRIPPSTTSTTTTTVKPVAKRFCGDPGFIDNGDRWTAEGRASSRGSFEVGKSVVFSCRSGYALQGLSILSCLDSLEWSNVLPECRFQFPSPPIKDYEEEDEEEEDLYCSDPGSVDNAERTEIAWIDARRKNNNGEDKFPQGFRFNYKCKKGYVLQGESTIACLYTGEWSAKLPTCIYSSRPVDIEYCLDPGEVENAVKLVITLIDERKKDGVMKRSKDMEYPEGVKLRYICMDGYQIQGHDTIECMNTGEWDMPPPYCL